MKNDRADLAIRLVEERARLGFSQADFAQKVGISREGLRLYEVGQRGMSAEFLAESASLGLDVQYVLTGMRSSNLAELDVMNHPKAAAVAAGTMNGNVVGIVSAGAVVNQVHTQHHVQRTIAEVKPGDEHISEDQAAELTSLVNQIVDREALLKKAPRTHRSVWAALNAHCGVTRYRLIPKDQFSKARKYLDQWMGRLGSMPSAPGKVGDEWRKRHYAYIKINSKMPEDEEAVRAYMKRNFAGDSLTKLTDDELRQLYKYVADRRSKVKRS